MSLSSYSVSDQPYPKEEHFPPSASAASTLVLLGGIAFAYVSLFANQQHPALLARSVAISVGIGLITSIGLDSRRGLRNLFRTDLVCLISLYYLILAEFLFPQEPFNAILSIDQCRNGLILTLVGFASFAIGRHLVKPQAMRSPWLNFGEVSTNTLFWIVVLSATLGYYYMLQSVHFNVIAMVDAMLQPRFTQPWGRGRIGNATSLLTELGLLLYIIPPLTGVLWNRRHLMPFYQGAIVFSLFAFTLFQAFAGGTRNVLVAYLAAFSVGYLLTLPRYNFRNTVLPIILTFLITAYASYHMLEFRTIGLRDYVENKVYAGDTVRETLSVDYNLGTLGLLPDVIPSAHSYLGAEIIVWALIKPIPRVFMPNKPEGLSISLEDIVGAEGFTVAATYIGEAYMMAGYWGIIGTSLFLGALAAWWNRLVLQRQSDYAMVVFALGFFAGTITMRSLFALTTAILPVIALIVGKRIGIIR